MKSNFVSRNLYPVTMMVFSSIHFHLENFTPQEMLGLGEEQGRVLKYLENSDSFYKNCKLSTTNSYSLVEFLFRGTLPATFEQINSRSLASLRAS